MTPEEFIAQYGTVTLNWEGIDKVLVDEDHVVTYKNNVFFSSFTIVLHENQYVVHGEHNTTRIMAQLRLNITMTTDLLSRCNIGLSMEILVE